MAGGLAEWDQAIRAFESRLASELPGASSRAAFQMREALARMYVERGRLADAARLQDLGALDQVRDAGGVVLPQLPPLALRGAAGRAIGEVSPSSWGP